MDQKWKNNLLIWLLFFLLTAILYWEARFAGMVMDYTGWLEKFDGKPWTDVFQCFGFPANQQLAIGFLYLMVEVIGQKELVWSIVYWSFHTTNALLLYHLLKDIFGLFDIGKREERAFIAALLWLCCCYQGEVVIWKVSQNYFLLALINLLMLRAYLRYFITKQSKHFWRASVLFVLALFTFEQALVNIAVVFIIYFGLVWTQKLSFDRTTMTKVALPMILSVIIYFVSSFVWIGDWVGHYGSDAHLSFDIPLIAGNYARFFLKYLMYWRFYDYSSKEFIVKSMDHWYWLVILILAVIQGLKYYYTRQKSEKILSLVLLGLVLVMFLPVSNLHMVWQGVSSGDRYGYFPSMFFFPWLAILIYQWRYNHQLFIAIALLVINVSLLGNTTNAWKSNQYLNKHLTDAYKWEDEDLVLFLNSPDNFNNTFLFIDVNHHGFQDALEYYGRKQLKGEVYDVIQYNMFTTNDGVSVNTINENEFVVSLNQWGNWWFNKGIGASKNIESPYFTLEIEHWYCYRLKLKPSAKDAVLIYQDGPELKEVKRH